MNAFWLIPAIVVAIGMAVTWYLSREAAAAARELREGVARFGEIRVALTRLQRDGDELRQGLVRHRRK
ncbi:MAG: hypothetical protein ACRDJP_05275 [Actinomycetota bacterium]